MTMKTSFVYLLIAHGSREPQANQAFDTLLERFKKLKPQRKIYGAFLELAKPSISEALEEAIAQGARDIVIIPLMFFPGRHVKEHIPAFMEQAKARHLEVDFHYAGALSDHPMLLTLLDQRTRGFKKSHARRKRTAA